MSVRIGKRKGSARSKGRESAVPAKKAASDTRDGSETPIPEEMAGRNSWKKEADKGGASAKEDGGMEKIEAKGKAQRRNKSKGERGGQV